MLLSILALFIAGIITTIFHLIFTPFLDPFPQSFDVCGLGREGSGHGCLHEGNPFAVYSALIAHGMGHSPSLFRNPLKKAYDRINNIVRPQWIGPLIVAGFWMYADIQNDLKDAPIGPAWTALDVVVTAVLSFSRICWLEVPIKHVLQTNTTRNGAYVKTYRGSF